MNIVTLGFMRFTVSLLFIINTLFVFGKGDDAFIELNLPTFDNDGIFSTASPPEDDWWRELNDNTLDSLITLAISNNQDIFVAMDNILAARASYRIAQSTFYPSISLERGWSTSKNSRNLGDETDRTENKLLSSPITLLYFFKIQTCHTLHLLLIRFIEYTM